MIRSRLRQPRTLFKATGLIALLSTHAVHAHTACLDENRPVALIGRLSERRLDARTLRDLPAVSRGPFYILDLDRPICFNGGFSESVLKDIGSVHVFSLQHAKIRLLHENTDRHVRIDFVSLFEGHTAHHRRNVVGQVETVTPVKN
jgi:hypothetical protein